MSERHDPPFPAWLDRVRRANSRRHAKMSPKERIADIHRGAQEAWKLLECSKQQPSRRHPRRKDRPSSA